MKNNPLVSVVVPTKNSKDTIAACLKSIKNQTYENKEIIVVDNNSTDATKKIAGKYTRLVFNKGPERSVQRNFGASKSKGRYLLFIDSDMILSKNVVKECVEAAMHKDIVYNVRKFGGIIIPENSFGEGYWASCKALERSFYIGVDWMEAARFFPKEIFKEFKGYDENQTGTEDFDLPQRIKEKYGLKSMTRVKSLIYHDEGKISLSRSLRKKFYYASTARQYSKSEVNKEMFKKQSSVVSRFGLFFSSPKKLFLSPSVGLGMLFMKTNEFLFGGTGYIFGKYFKNNLEKIYK